jgi:hypothetical protein
MSTYRVNPIGGGGFKVRVVNDAGSARVVGVFCTEAAAHAWIAPDSLTAGTSGDHGAHPPSRRANQPRRIIRRGISGDSADQTE